MVTLCPSDCRPTAASTTKRSAPPMPRSGCTKTTLRGVVEWASAAMLDDRGELHDRVVDVVHMCCSQCPI